jgi:hypothetical protein
MKESVFIFFFAFVLASWNCLAVQFDASVPPKGAFYLKIHPIVFVTSARFDDSGKPRNLEHISQLSYVDTQTEFYYSITDSLMAGGLVPVAYMGRSYVSEESSSETKIRNPWVIVKHQFWSEGIVSASSLRVKLPITEIDPFEEGFDVDDKQVDVYPVYYVDWMMSAGTYIYGQIGYKYRMKNDHIKPGDELKLLVETGYAIVPGIIRIFTFSDFTRFFASKINDEKDELSAGYLYTIAAGVRFFLGRNLRVEVLTNANPFGKNQYRGIGGHVGVGYVLGM